MAKRINKITPQPKSMPSPNFRVFGMIASVTASTGKNTSNMMPGNAAQKPAMIMRRSRLDSESEMIADGLGEGGGSGESGVSFMECFSSGAVHSTHFEIGEEEKTGADTQER